MPLIKEKGTKPHRCSSATLSSCSARVACRCLAFSSAMALLRLIMSSIEAHCAHARVTWDHVRSGLVFMARGHGENRVKVCVPCNRKGGQQPL